MKQNTAMPDNGTHPDTSSAKDASRETDSLLECLAFLTKYHEKPIPAESLRSGIVHSHQKITLDNFIRISEKHGFATEVINSPLNEISQILLPCVLLLDDGGACVLVRREGRKYLVMTPGTREGVSRIDEEVLNEEYTGQIVLFQPKFQFDARSQVLNLPDSRSWFWGTILSNWRIYGLALLGTVLVNLFVLASPLFVMTVYDRVVPNTAFDTLWVLAIGVGTIAIFDFIVKTMRAYFVDAVGKRTDFIISSLVFEQILNIKLSAKQKSSGVMANTLKEFEAIRDFFTSATLTTIGDFPFVLLFIFVIWLIGGPIAIIPIIAVPLVLIVGIVIQIPLGKVVQESFQESALKNAHLFEVLNNIEPIKTSGIEAWASKNWENYVGRTAKSQMKSRMYSSVAVHFAQFMMLVTTIFIIIYGVYEIEKGEMTLGTLIACMILSSRAMAPLIQVSSLLVRYQQSRASLNALHKLMTTPTERPENKRFIQRTKLQGSIEFKDVSFHYPEQPNEALKNINCMINPGEKVGIVGRIGAGKSTILRLIMGLYHPDEGMCLVDGIDTNQIDPQDLRRNIGCVQQDSALFFGTIRDNITIGAPYVDDETILKASELAGVDQFVKTTPLGYDQPVGERGELLSGGQRQAITIARALLLDPSILLLDEPTGHMDHTSEKQFITRLKSVIANKTLLVVTHRTALLELVDRLMIFDQGKIVADGPKDEILKMLTEQSRE